MLVKVLDELMRSNAKAKGYHSRKCRNLGVCPNVGVTLRLTLASKGAPVKRACYRW
jgi:hypothetical protein